MSLVLSKNCSSFLQHFTRAHPLKQPAHVSSRRIQSGLTAQYHEGRYSLQVVPHRCSHMNRYPRIYMSSHTHTHMNAHIRSHILRVCLHELLHMSPHTRLYTSPENGSHVGKHTKNNSHSRTRTRALLCCALEKVSDSNSQIHARRFRQSYPLFSLVGDSRSLSPK